MDLLFQVQVVSVVELPSSPHLESMEACCHMVRSLRWVPLVLVQVVVVAVAGQCVVV